MHTIPPCAEMLARVPQQRDHAWRSVLLSPRHTRAVCRASRRRGGGSVGCMGSSPRPRRRLRCRSCTPERMQAGVRSRNPIRIDSSHKVQRDLEGVFGWRVAFGAGYRCGRMPRRCLVMVGLHSTLPHLLSELSRVWTCCIGKSTGSSGYASSSDGDPLSQRWSIQAQLPPAILAATQCRIPTDSAVIGCACASASSPASTLSSL